MDFCFFENLFIISRKKSDLNTSKKMGNQVLIFNSGATDGIRTHDPLDHNQML